MDKDRLYGNCHCGTVQLSIPRNIDMSAVRRCDCSLCKRRGAVMLACPIEDVKIETGAEHLVHYKWNTKVATHHFCSKCGICLLYTSPSPRDGLLSRMPSSA